MKLGAIIGPWLQTPSTPEPIAREEQGTDSTLNDFTVSLDGSPTAEAERWLAERLTFPCRIGLLIREWCGQRDGDTGRWVRDLLAARHALHIQAYEESDGFMWWRLPTAEPDLMEAEERAAIQEEGRT